MTEAFNMDCMQAMREMPDNAFDLAIVDPPYGGANSEIGGGGCRTHYTFGLRKNDKNYKNRREMGGEIRKKIVAWDIDPDQKYFEELFRVSRNQIIWGGNYFQLPPTRCFVVWRKLSISEEFSMAMAEYAWTSFTSNAKVFEYAPQGKQYDKRFHPTQKPVALYKWLLNNYAKQGDKILDTHLGSGSSRIAAYDLGFDFVGYEIDPEYFEQQEERFRKHTNQINMFTDLGVT